MAGGVNLVSNFSFTAGSGTTSMTYGYVVPNGINFAGINGAVSLANNLNRLGRATYTFGYLPSGQCPTAGQAGTGLPAGAVAVWQNTLETDQQGSVASTADFTMHYPLAIPGNCLIVNVDTSGSLSSKLTASVSLTLTYTPNSGGPSFLKAVSLAGDFAFGANYGAHSTTNDNLAFATAQPLYTFGAQSIITGIWGNLSASPLGSPYAQTSSSTFWVADHDVYVYHGSECYQFPSLQSGPGNYYANIPADANHLLGGSLLVPGGSAPMETISYLQAGYTNGVTAFQNYSYTIQPGDCLVALSGVRGTAPAIDSTQSLTAFISCTPSISQQDLQLAAADSCVVYGPGMPFSISDGCGNLYAFQCTPITQIAQITSVLPDSPSGPGNDLFLDNNDAIQAILLRVPTTNSYSASQVVSAVLFMPEDSVFLAPDLVIGQNANSTWDANTVDFDNAPLELPAEMMQVVAQPGYVTTATTATQDGNFPNGATVFDVTNDWIGFQSGAPNGGWYIQSQDGGRVIFDPDTYLLVQLPIPQQ